MPPRRIELVRVGGTHREVGFQIGTATAEVVRRHAAAIDTRRLAQAAECEPDARGSAVPTAVVRRCTPGMTLSCSTRSAMASGAASPE